MVTREQYYRRTVLGTSATAVGSISGCAARDSETDPTPTRTTRTPTPELTPIDGAEPNTEFLDRVYFGNEDSEGDRNDAKSAPVIEVD